jgi:hypothetical protein
VVWVVVYVCALYGLWFVFVRCMGCSLGWCVVLWVVVYVPLTAYGVRRNGCVSRAMSGFSCLCAFECLRRVMK